MASRNQERAMRRQEGHGIRAATHWKSITRKLEDGSSFEVGGFHSLAWARTLVHRLDRRVVRQQLEKELIGGEGPIGPEFRDIFSVGTIPVHINPGMLVGVSRCAAPVRTTVHPSHADILLKLRMHHVHPYAPSWCMRNRH